MKIAATGLYFIYFSYTTALPLDDVVAQYPCDVINPYLVVDYNEFTGIQ